MGVPFLEHIGGKRLYNCVKCQTVFTNHSHLLSTKFTGATGRAWLFDKVVNIVEAEAVPRGMITGRHVVRDVSCKKCNAKVGWIYEHAAAEDQCYKEGKVILEKALIMETAGVDEEDGTPIPPGVAGPARPAVAALNAAEQAELLREARANAYLVAAAGGPGRGRGLGHGRARAIREFPQGQDLFDYYHDRAIRGRRQ